MLATLKSETQSKKESSRSAALPPTSKSDQCIAECDTRISRMRALKATVAAYASPVVRDQLEYIIDRCDKIQSAIVDDKKVYLSEQFLEEYVKPAQSWLETYARLKSRDLDLARSAVEESEDAMLPLLSRKFNAFYNQLHVGDIAKLATADVAIELAKKAEVKLELEALV
jgi:hypothetical protein